MAVSFDAVLIIVVVSLNSIPSNTLAWNLSGANLPRDILIWRFAVWRNRAFLAVPRWQKNLKLPCTLLEAPWPEVGLGNTLQFGTAHTKITPFPNLESQLEDDCRYFQSVTGLDTDARGRLWILDAPRNDVCRAKIVLFDLRRNEEITRSELVGVPTRSLQCIAVDPVAGQWGPRAYIGDPGDGSVIVYSLGQRKWWRLTLSHGPDTPGVYSTDMAISRKNSMLYLTGYASQDLFSIDLEGTRNDEGPMDVVGNESMRNTSVTWLGAKMGSSSGLICDMKGGLHYFMVTERASVRWDTRQQFEAGSHSILLQSEDVPCVTDYAMDSQRNVWALVNERHPFRKKMISGQEKKQGIKSPEQRTVKVYRYNPFSF